MGLCIEPEGQLVKQELDISYFNSIRVSSAATVVISQGENQEVSVSAPENYLALLNKEVDDQEWDISFERCLSQGQEIEIYITIEDLEEAEIAGSGIIIGEGMFSGDELELEISGSGSIRMELNYKEVDLGIHGSGDIDLEGETKELDISVNGSGDISANGLISDDTKVRINGSGDARVFANEKLDVVVNGSGSVYYGGSPRDISSTFNGSGELIQQTD